MNKIFLLLLLSNSISMISAMEEYEEEYNYDLERPREVDVNDRIRELSEILETTTNADAYKAAAKEYNELILGVPMGNYRLSYPETYAEFKEE